MTWICSPSVNNCIIKFYSIASDIKVLNEGIFDFLIALSPGVWMMTIIITILSFIIVLIASVTSAIKNAGDNFG